MEKKIGINNIKNVKSNQANTRQQRIKEKEVTIMI